MWAVLALVGPLAAAPRVRTAAGARPQHRASGAPWSASSLRGVREGPGWALREPWELCEVPAGPPSPPPTQEPTP